MGSVWGCVDVCEGMCGDVCVRGCVCGVWMYVCVWRTVQNEN